MNAWNMEVISATFEVRFEENYSTLSYFGEFQKKYKSEYPVPSNHDGVINISKVPLENGIFESKMFLSSINLGITFNIINSVEEFIENCKEFLESSSERLGIEQFTRIGIRVNLLKPVKDLHKEQLDFLSKLFGIKALNQLGNTVRDLEFRFKSSSEDFDYMMSFNFVEKAEGIENERLPKRGLLVDFDASKDDISMADCLVFLDYAIDKSIIKSQKFLDNFLARGVK